MATEPTTKARKGGDMSLRIAVTNKRSRGLPLLILILILYVESEPEVRA